MLEMQHLAENDEVLRPKLVSHFRFASGELAPPYCCRIFAVDAWLWRSSSSMQRVYICDIDVQKEDAAHTEADLKKAHQDLAQAQQQLQTLQQNVEELEATMAHYKASTSASPERLCIILHDCTLKH